MSIFNLCGVVDVGTYGTILDPYISIGGDETTEEQWEQFQFSKYMEAIRTLAVTELKSLLEKLPLKVTYVECSAWIDSPKYYNYRNDMLCFQVKADTDMTEKQLQGYVEDELKSEINQEFGPPYSIYEYLSNNCTVEDFYESTD